MMLAPKTAAPSKPVKGRAPSRSHSADSGGAGVPSSMTEPDVRRATPIAPRSHEDDAPPAPAPVPKHSLAPARPTPAPAEAARPAPAPAPSARPAPPAAAPPADSFRPARPAPPAAPPAQRIEPAKM
jgi:hypothetical protein